MIKLYDNPSDALRAAQRIANRTGKQVKVLLPYPHKVASKYIAEEFRAGRKGKQAVAIGIARARGKRNPSDGEDRVLERRIVHLLKKKRVIATDDVLPLGWWGSFARRGYTGRDIVRVLDGLRSKGSVTVDRSRGASAWRLTEHNPQWLQGTVPRHMPTGHELTRFYDSARELKGEMFQLPGESPRLLLHRNPTRKRKRR